MLFTEKNGGWYLALIVLVMLAAFQGPANAAVKMPAIFADHMVLQQRAKVMIWGWADPGETVVVQTPWSRGAGKTQADGSGKWRLWIHTPAAGGPFVIKIDGSNHIELNDVLVGEVWLCSGQSNMVFSLKGAKDAAREIKAADLPSIRYFSVTRQYAGHLFDDSPGAVWQKCSPATAPSFSAVAYFFARKIQKELKVPVGIVYSAWGGTPAEAWTPEPVLKGDTILTRYNDRWRYIQEHVGKDSVAYHIALAKWEKGKKGVDSTDTGKTDDVYANTPEGGIARKPAEPQTLYYYDRPWREPGVLFNGMINPVIPFGIKGVLWYQGESNVNYANEYYRLLSAMIRSWRQRWGVDGKPSDFPFYVVQISAFGYSSLDNAARVREAEYEIGKKVPNSGVAVTVDLGNMKNIHFTRKKEVGDRLALIALARDYGRKKLNYKGPECKRVTVEGGKAVVEFEPSAVGLAVGDGGNTAAGNGSATAAGSGSAATAGDGSVKGFEIGYRAPSGDSLLFVPAQAKMEGDKVIVAKEGIGDPVEVRYAWLLAGEANLFDKGGLPAFPFRKKVEGKK